MRLRYNISAADGDGLFFVIKEVTDDALASGTLKHVTFGCVSGYGIKSSSCGIVWEVTFEHAPVAIYRPVKTKCWFLSNTTLQPGKCYKLAGPS